MLVLSDDSAAVTTWPYAPVDKATEVPAESVSPSSAWWITAGLSAGSLEVHGNWIPTVVVPTFALPAVDRPRQPAVGGSDPRHRQRLLRAQGRPGQGRPAAGRPSGPTVR